jgi:uncharacterized protein YjbI with pentapeptide repeats
MNIILHEQKSFEDIDYSEKKLTDTEFYKCKFHNCNFTKSDFSDIDFIDCNFTKCNFTLTILKNSGLKDIHFNECKIMGIDFSICNNFLFTLHFNECHLDNSTFHSKKLKKTNFINCTLKEVDFSEVDLTSSVFQNCDLSNSTFNQTILDKVDFRTAVNYVIEPDRNRIKKAKFSLTGLPGLLAKYDIIVESE